MWPLAKDSWGPEEREAVQRVLRSNRLTIGPEVEAFEHEFAAYHGKDLYAVMVNSGSSANLLAVAALHALDASPGVWLVPTLGWATTYSPIHQYGYKMVPVPIDTSYNMDCRAVSQVVSSNQVKGVMLVHVLGQMAEAQVIREWCKDNGAYLIEDTCESLGAQHIGGPLAGTVGDIGTFSFYFSHHIHGVEGGMCLTRDYNLYSIMRSLRSHGWTRGIPYLEQALGRYSPFDFCFPGYNLRPTELSAAPLREQLRKLPLFLETRRKNLRRWQEYFEGSCAVTLQHHGPLSSAFAFAMVYNEREGRRDFDSTLRALIAAGIDHRPVIGGNILKHRVNADYYKMVGSDERANDIHRSGFYIGNNHEPIPYDQFSKLRDILHS